MNTRDIQEALAAAGFDPGGIDGIPGRMTTAAIKAFQRARGLDVDGIVGTITEAALFPKRAPSKQLPLPWYVEATHLLGVREAAGPANNPKILDWADDLDLHYPADSIAWCGLFVAHCIGSTLPEEILPKNPLGARNWGTFGIPCDPQVGAVLTFWRGSKKGWMGHTGFYHRERKDAYLVRGGNQSNSVSDAWIAKSRLLESRWPKTAPFLATGVVIAGGGGSLSTDEA